MSRTASFVALLALLLAPACRDAHGGDATAGSAVVPSTAGMNGCRGPDQTFTAGAMLVPVPLATLAIGPSSQLAASAAAELLYATGANATVVALDVSGASPVETELVSAGTVDALLALAGITDPAELAGVTVLDAQTLLVVERTSNTILSVDRTTPDTVGFFAGLPSTLPGFADGLATGTAGLARFSFSEPCMLCASGESPPRVFVSDPGNHAVRVIDGDGVVRTIAGHGSALFGDGDLASSFLDTPTGVAIACDGDVLVSERGAGGFGNRLRAISVGAASPFGGFFGSASTLAGDGTNATSEGPSLAGAELARPVAPFLTQSGETYWVDSATGVLRRRASGGACDCPLHADCASAVLAPELAPDHVFALAGTPAGVLYVLDATAGTLFRVTP